MGFAPAVALIGPLRADRTVASAALSPQLSAAIARAAIGIGAGRTIAAIGPGSGRGTGGGRSEETGHEPSVDDLDDAR